MKKFLILLFACVLLVGCNETKENKENNTAGGNDNQTEPRLLFSLDEYKDLTRDKVESIELIKFTEAGDARQTYTNESDIDTIYSVVSSIKIANKTERACEDNTTVYNLVLNDGTTRSVEIECEWVVVGKNRYEIVYNN